MISAVDVVLFSIFIPVIVTIIGIVIAVVVIFGSGMMHHQASPPIENPSPAPVNQQPPTSPSVQNIPPTAIDQAVTTDQSTPVDIKLAGSDPNMNDVLTAQVVSPPSHGNLSIINERRIVTYTPYAGYTGTDSFTFKVNDGRADSSNIGTVNIRVNSPSSSPSSNVNPSSSSPQISGSSSPPPGPGFDLPSKPSSPALSTPSPTTTANQQPIATDQSVTTNLNTAAPSPANTEPSEYVFVRKWSGFGGRSGSYNMVAVDSLGYLYTIQNNQTLKFDSSGNLITQWSLPLGNWYRAFAVDPNTRNVYVPDNDGIVRKFAMAIL